MSSHATSPQGGRHRAGRSRDLFRGAAAATTLAAVLLGFAGHEASQVGQARARVAPAPSTFEQSESERRWGASGLLTHEARDELDRLERTARRRAAQQVGLSERDIALVAQARRAADARRGELEAAGEDGHLSGRALARIHAAARHELGEIERVLCASCARALLAAEREMFRELLAEQTDGAPSGARAFIERRMLFLRMGLTPAEPPAEALTAMATACAHRRDGLE